MSDVVYAREQTLSAGDYIAVVGSTYMRDRRPLANEPRIAEILAGSNVIVTARDTDGTIAGVARGISDGAWVCYLADLVIRDGYQRRGVGTALLDATKAILGPRISIILVAYPEAVDFYRRIGLGEMPAFYLDREDRA